MNTRIYLALAGVLSAAIITLALPTSAAPAAMPAPASQATTLSREEIADLQFMREEEKLAHDVYAALYAKWKLPTFQNISQSETTHTNTIRSLLQRYQINDPVDGQSAGQFADAKLQALYTQLVQEGSQSLAAALKVGATIEELDIQDLQERLVRTHASDVQFAYQNLEKGSRNHLRAFASQMKQQGVSYTPQYLDSARYQAIVNSRNERGPAGKK